MKYLSKAVATWAIFTPLIIALMNDVPSAAMDGILTFTLILGLFSLTSIWKNSNG